MFSWRKSSYSGAEAECVEVGFTWRKSSYTATEECVEVGFTWQKSSYTAKDECVEVLLAETVGVRDTKARHLGQLTVSRAAWTALTSVVQPPGEHRG